jgi:trans-2-enoyl-CoA reductase
MSEHIKLEYERCGSPLEVVRAVVQDRREPLAGEIEVGLEHAVVHPSDFGMIAGTYGKTVELPAIPGREGVGVVSRVGEGVTGIKEGDRVSLRGSGVWASWHYIGAAGVDVLPQGLDSLQLAQAWVNPPTALQLIRQVPLQRGDWVIQNAANSAVGVWVIGLCRHFGYKTVNVVRNESRVDELKALGADEVVTEESGYEKKLESITGGARPLLALNSIGGESAMRLIKSLADDGMLVTFGGMVGDPVRFPTRYLIFNSIVMQGYWMDKWVRTHSSTDVAALYSEVYQFMRDGVARIPIDSVYPLADYRVALERASCGGRSGKVLLSGPMASK